MSFKERRQKHKKKRKHGRYTFLDFVGDVLFYVPELFFLPFRLLWWVIRGLVRLFDWT